jgi:hypothetical protein
MMLTACGRASGDTGMAPPAGWVALPEIANAIGATAKLDGIQAWGEPSKGCYAVSIAADGGGDLVGELLAALAAEKVATTDIVKPTGATGVLAFSIARGTYHGKVRAQIDTDRVAALACYHNDREPLACETQCATFLGSR